MTEEERVSFRMIFKTLAIALQLRDPHPDAPQIYFRALADLPLDAVQDAAVRLARGDVDGRPAKWFPTTAEWHREGVDVLKELAQEREHARLALPADETPELTAAQQQFAADLEALKAKLAEEKPRERQEKFERIRNLVRLAATVARKDRA